MSSTTTTDTEEKEQLSVKYLRYAAGTDIGRRREENQDNFGVIYGDQHRVYIVADGMGGAKGGAIASGLAVKTVKKRIKQDKELTVDSLKTAVEQANEEINGRGVQDPRLNGMGTTLVGLAFVGKRLFITNVGDSRAFRVRDGEIKQLTHDHTLVQEMVRAGSITAEQAESHPISHMLTRSLGPSAEVEVDCWEYDLYKSGDRYLLCSDGLYNLVKEDETKTIILENDIDEAVQKLIDLANERGGNDNITIILIQVMDSADKGSPEKIEQEVDEKLEEKSEKEPDTLRMQRPLAATSPGEELNEAESEKTEINFQLVDQPELKDQPYEEEKFKERIKVRTPLVLSLVTLVAFVVGGLFGPQIFNNKKPEQEKVAVKKVAEEPRQIDTREKIEQLSPEGEFPEIPIANIALTESEIGDPRERENNLVRRLEEIERKLAAVESFSAEEVQKRITNIDLEKQRMSLVLTALKRDLDGAARKLSVWYERKRRLAASDPINMATEIAALSDDVRSKKEMFETKTWEYLKSVEQLRYEPENKELDQKVAELVRERTDAMRSLVASIKVAVDKEVSEGEKAIAENTIKRNDFETELLKLDDEKTFLNRIISSSPTEKTVLGEGLIRERELTQAEQSKVRETLSRKSL